MSTLLIYLLASAALLSTGFASGWKVESWRADAAQLASQKATTAAIEKAAEDARALGVAEGKITFTAAQHVAEIQEKIVTRTVTQIKEVPIYVTKISDDACRIPMGFVRLFNRAAAGSDAADFAFSLPAGLTNDTPTTIKLATVAATIADNFGRYHKLSADDAELIAWVQKQQALHNEAQLTAHK